jgi:hypothetical protein
LNFLFFVLILLCVLAVDNAVAVAKEVKDCADVSPGDDARRLRKRAQMKKERA